jgi:hypothetical protein
MIIQLRRLAQKFDHAFLTKSLKACIDFKAKGLQKTYSSASEFYTVPLPYRTLAFFVYRFGRFR